MFIIGRFTKTQEWNVFSKIIFKNFYIFENENIKYKEMEIPPYSERKESSIEDCLRQPV